MVPKRGPFTIFWGLIGTPCVEGSGRGVFPTPWRGVKILYPSKGLGILCKYIQYTNSDISYTCKYIYIFI